MLRFHDVTSTGDIFQIMWTGDNPVQPTTPTGLSASGTDVGCANISWDTPDPAEYVYEYVLAWGPSPGTFTDSTVVNTSSVSSQGGTSTYIHCGLPDGRYCFAIRAHNLYDMWSGYTGQECADVTNGSTQGPPPPQGVAVSQTGLGCATATWNAVSDPSVSGYMVYYGQQSSTYTDSVDAGQATTREICSLAEGTHYFAVKSYTGGGVNSVFSAERAVTISTRPPTPQNVAVSETDFGCAAIWWDAAGGLASGYKVYYGDQSGVYVDSLNVDADTNAEICGFSEGTYYFAVKSYAWAGDHSDFSTERSLAMAGVDDEAPTVSSMNPADGEPDVELNRSIRFVLVDDKTGVDQSSVAVTVNGTNVSNLGFIGTPASFDVVATPDSDLPANSTVNVSVTVSDLASAPNQHTEAWSFETGDVTIVDTDPPVFSGMSPADGATDVATDVRDIRVNVVDDGMGIDMSTIEFYVNGETVAYSTQGTSANLTLIYENTGGFAPNATVTVRVVASDLASPANRDEVTFT
ncbi:MAG: Ig-like domain-containing protein, partial [Candidatus Krumholzibacteria bacterium]|nr:Ig-like domain-containing protein [Candidatus Krumholzibacteria bacterium]